MSACSGLWCCGAFWPKNKKRKNPAGQTAGFRRQGLKEEFLVLGRLEFFGKLAPNDAK